MNPTTEEMPAIIKNVHHIFLYESYIFVRKEILIYNGLTDAEKRLTAAVCSFPFRTRAQDEILLRNIFAIGRQYRTISTTENNMNAERTRPSTTVVRFD